MLHKFFKKEKPIFTGYRFGFGAAQPSGDSAGGGTGNFFIASGGTETTSGDYRIHTFNSDDTFQVTQTLAGSAPSANAMELLVVGGGGAGGSQSQDGPLGGGGGGGLVYIPVSDNETIIDETGTYPVVIGQGGSGQTGPAPNHGAITNPGGSSYLSVPPSIGELNNRIEGVGGGGGYGSNTNAAPPGYPTGPYNHFEGPPFPMGGNPTTGGDVRGPGTFPSTGTPLTTSGVGWGGSGGGSKSHGSVDQGTNRGSYPSGPYNSVNNPPRAWIGDGIQPVMPGLAGQYGHGYPGGFGFTIIGGYRDSGGGGGAGGYGVPGPGPGGPGGGTNGGTGYTCSISGSPVVYAGGGAGAYGEGSGNPGGGEQTNRGGGGDAGANGGNGAPGVVIIKYKYQ